MECENNNNNNNKLKFAIFDSWFKNKSIMQD